MDKHLSQCPKQDKQNGLSKKHFHVDVSLEERKLALMEENLISLRKSLNEEIEMRHSMIVELGNLKKRNQVQLTILCSRQYH